MTWKIATWNVNSLKARHEHVLNWLDSNPIDILALQELKSLNICPEDFERLGYKVYYVGQKAYNGVAILTKFPIKKRPIKFLMHAPENQARFLAIDYEDTTVVCVYVPNGSEVGTDKYLYKLAWLDALEAWLYAKLKTQNRLVILGDFNIAPFNHDTFDPNVWNGKVLASEPERLRYHNLIDLGLVDIHDSSHKFTWWDYRAGAFAKDNGCRIDLVLATPSLVPVSYQVDKLPRSWPKPSDHCPVVVEFEGQI